MPLIRIEATSDAGPGRYYAKLFYPHDGLEPMVMSAAVYESQSEAMIQTIQLLCEAVKSGNTIADYHSGRAETASSK